MAQIWLAQERRGAKVQFVRSREACPTPEEYSEAIDQETLLVPLTHVSFRNGSTLAVKEITEIAHSRGAYVLLDDYQCTGTRPINVKDLNVDFLVTGMVKYMLGPPGHRLHLCKGGSDSKISALRDRVVWPAGSISHSTSQKLITRIARAGSKPALSRWAQFMRAWRHFR